MAQNPVGWFEIYVQDMARARAFYEKVLQHKLEHLPAPEAEGELEMWSFPMDMNGPGASGALVKMAGMSSGGNSTLVYFSCEDCGVEAGRVVAAGGKLQQAKMAIGQYGFIAIAIDPDGNSFGLHSMQ